MRDKDADAILRELLPVTSSVVATAANSARAMPAAELASHVKALDPERMVTVCAHANAALDEAVGMNTTVCVAGSIFLVGAVRDMLR
jgi:folylpolyglutamate synthase/dihydropteroate synthase